MKQKELIKKLEYISNNPLINGEFDEENYLSDDEAEMLLEYINKLQQKVKLLTTGLEATDKAYKDYKSRCKRAIEYINKYQYDKNTFNLHDLRLNSNHLLNILGGDIDE